MAAAGLGYVLVVACCRAAAAVDGHRQDFPCPPHSPGGHGPHYGYDAAGGLRVYLALGTPSFILLWLGMMPATLAVMINCKFHQVPISLVSDPHTLTVWRNGFHNKWGG